MFKETAFKFDGIPCTDYGLMIYYLSDSSTRDIGLGTNVSVVEDRLSKRIDPITYGASMNESLSFPLTFGSTETMTEAQVEEILEWLTGHQQYKWLELYESNHLCDDSDDNSADHQNEFNITDDSGTLSLDTVPFATDINIKLEALFDGADEPITLEFNNILHTPSDSADVGTGEATDTWDEDGETKSVTLSVQNTYNSADVSYLIETSDATFNSARVIVTWNDVYCIRYKCHIDNVEIQYVNALPFAFEANIECDGQFGYVYPPVITDYSVSSTPSTKVLTNHSSYNGYLYPSLLFSTSGGCNMVSIANNSDNGREFKIDTSDADFTLDDLTVNIDCRNGIIYAVDGNDDVVNLYPYFNKKFLRLLKGDNSLTVRTDSGTCTLSVTCVWRRKVSI